MKDAEISAAFVLGCHMLGSNDAPHSPLRRALALRILVHVSADSRWYNSGGWSQHPISWTAIIERKRRQKRFSVQAWPVGGVKGWPGQWPRDSPSSPWRVSGVEQVLRLTAVNWRRFSESPACGLALAIGSTVGQPSRYRAPASDIAVRCVACPSIGTRSTSCGRFPPGPVGASSSGATVCASGSERPQNCVSGKGPWKSVIQTGSDWQA